MRRPGTRTAAVSAGIALGLITAGAAAELLPPGMLHAGAAWSWWLLPVLIAGAAFGLWRFTRSGINRPRDRMELQIAVSEHRLRAVLDHIVDAVLYVDERGAVESSNPAAERLFGFGAEELRGRAVAQLLPPPVTAGEAAAGLPAHLADMAGGTREASGRHKSGALFPLELTVSRMAIHGRLHYVVILRDITQRRAQLAALRHQALHDSLTGLPNRALLLDRIEHAIHGARRNHRPLALMIADLDHFKEINDTLGHPCGDLILRETARRMSALMRSSDTVARLGGDEFALLLPATDPADAARIADKVAREIERPFALEGHSFMLGASIGIAMFPEHGEDSSTLMRHADVAMYAAKREHRGHAVYEPEQDRHGLRHLALKSELHTALESDQLKLCYQPVVDLHSGRVTGVEALVRWNHPSRGLLGPDEFIPLAERTGLIRPLTLWVLKTAARHSRAWVAHGLELRVAVNLSAHNLHDGGLPDIVSGLLGHEGRPVQLRLEITETVIMPGSAHALEVLNRLSAQGVRISIDDFGTGYSSLAYLKRLPIDEVKIDKSFVSAMAFDNDDAVIVRSTIDLAHNIGLRVVAEGVEDRATYDLLAGMRCDSVQGFYISRPLEADDLLTWLRKSGWYPATGAA
ncbi:MAG: EAL domain-containing protein [Gammaproteobacteria bacterium]|nr:EAL domain-containing protein [Gammaproteobacteria bacterium]